jgi:hypothetical protein
LNLGNSTWKYSDLLFTSLIACKYKKKKPNHRVRLGL